MVTQQGIRKGSSRKQPFTGALGDKMMADPRRGGERGILDRGNSKCRNPEVGMSLVSSRKRRRPEQLEGNRGGAVLGRVLPEATREFEAREKHGLISPL